MAAARLIYLFGFLVCAGLLGFALYLQHVKFLDPCPLCIFQRIVFILFGVVCLIAALHNPARWGRRAYPIIGVILSATGIALAARHVWLQRFPESIQCGAGLEYMLEQFPLTEVFSMVLEGSGECADVLWRFLGLSIPEWTLVVFVLFLLTTLFFSVRPPRNT